VKGLDTELAKLIGIPYEAPQLPARLPELTEALRKCTPRQRIALRALAENDFIVKRTQLALKEAGYDWAKPSYVAAQLREPKVRAARETLESMAAESLGITAASTLARIHKVVETALQDNDRQHALKGLGMLAAATGATPSGKANVNVGVQVLVPVEQRYDRLEDAGIRVIEG